NCSGAPAVTYSGNYSQHCCPQTDTPVVAYCDITNCYSRHHVSHRQSPPDDTVVVDNEWTPRVAQTVLFNKTIDLSSDFEDDATTDPITGVDTDNTTTTATTDISVNTMAARDPLEDIKSSVDGQLMTDDEDTDEDVSTGSQSPELSPILTSRLRARKTVLDDTMESSGTSSSQSTPLNYSNNPLDPLSPLDSNSKHSMSAKDTSGALDLNLSCLQLNDSGDRDLGAIGGVNGDDTDDELPPIRTSRARNTILDDTIESLNTSSSPLSDGNNELMSAKDSSDGHYHDLSGAHINESVDRDLVIVPEVLNFDSIGSGAEESDSGPEIEEIPEPSVKPKHNPLFRRDIPDILDMDDLDSKTRKANEREDRRIADQKQRLKEFRNNQRYVELSDDEDRDEDNVGAVQSLSRRLPQVVDIASDSDAEESAPPVRSTPTTSFEDFEVNFDTYGVHTDDAYNIKDARGRVLVNVGHPGAEPDLFLSEHMARRVKAHQIGGIRFIYDNIVDSIEKFRTTRKGGFGCILSHAMGLGKTFQVIAFTDVFLKAFEAKRHRYKQVLCVVPINTLQNWVSEFENWSPPRDRDYEVYSMDSTLPLIRRSEKVLKWHKSGGVLLLGYEMFRGLIKSDDKKYAAKQWRDYDREELEERDAKVRRALVDPGPDVVVCDEGHRIKNPNAAISIALKQIKTRRRVILTGTPLQNNLMEYWCMCDFVRPYHLGTQGEFKNMFEKPITNGQCVDSNELDVLLMKKRAFVLHQKVKGFVQRRSHEVLKTTLPVKREFVLMCRMTNMQKRLMQALIDKAIEDPEAIGRVKGKLSVLTLFSICTKIWNHPDIIHEVIDRGLEAQRQDLEIYGPTDGPLFDPNGKAFTDWSFAADVILNYTTRVIGNSNKMVVLFEIIDECLKIGDRLLVFSQSLFTLDLIEELLKMKKEWRLGRDYYRLDGSTPPQERERYINRFNGTTRAHLFLISTKAGSLGINLIGANRIVVMDANWNPSWDAQAACRVYRYGQPKETFIYRLVCDQTLEEKISKRQFLKHGMAKRVVDGQTIDPTFSWNEITSLLEDLQRIDDIPEVDFDGHELADLEDSLIQKVCRSVGHGLTRMPFEYDSLLMDKTDKKLNDNERAQALEDYNHTVRLTKFLAPKPTNITLGEPDEHLEVQEVDGVVDENIEVDDRDRDEMKGSEEMSEAEEGGESGVGDQHKDTPEVTEGGDEREGSDDCESNEVLIQRQYNMDYMDESHPLIGVEDNCSEYDSIEQLTLELDRSSNNSNGSNNNDRRSQSSVSQSMAISWHNIRVSSRPSNMFKRFRKSSTEPTEILKNVSGEVSAGQLLAIMGSSGAGKTTLLNVLTARNLSKLVVCGDVLLNGEVVDANTITSVSAYVQQQDLFVPVLTVREHLIFHSLLRMDPNLPQKERTDRVNEVILRFSLTKCAGTRIGSSTTFKGISGGESKRLAFASEYLTDPSIMFCDEPTSGLDSFMAQSIVQELKSMASEGRTVICTIHQPSSQVFELFEHLLLLADGRVAFMGKTDEAMDYFSSLGYHICDRFANKLSDTLSDTTDMVSAALFMNSFSVFERKSALNGHKYRTSIWRQLWTLLWRSKKFILRDTEFRWMFVIVPIAIFLGSVYWKQQVNQKSIRNINAALFVLVMNMTIQSAMAVINTFCAEQPLFLREHHNGMYRVGVYFISKNLADFPIYVLQSFLFVLIYYHMVGLNPHSDTFWMAVFIGILVTQCAVSFGYLMSCLTSTATTALKLGPPLLTPVILFGGYLLNTDSTPGWLSWMKYISWFYYGFEALVINEWKGVKISDCRPVSCNANSIPDPSCISSGDQVISQFDFHANNMIRNLFILVVLALVLRLCAFTALYLRSRRR
ncbi:unnamed protein product, partial [Oppiella nova]